jgi:hypothetical protein
MFDAGNMVKGIKRKVRQLLKMDEVDCKVIGGKPVKNITYVEAEKPKHRTLQKRQKSFVVTLPKQWVLKSIAKEFRDAKEAVDQSVIIVRQWRDPYTGKFKGIFIEVEKKDHAGT